MLDHDNPVTPVNQPVKHLEQPANVIEVKPRGGLIEEEKQPAATPCGQHPRGELQALRFSARERIEGLAELQVPETQGAEEGKRLREFFLVAEEHGRVIDRKLEDLVNIQVPVPDPEHLAAEPASVTGLAGQGDIREKLHLNLHHPRPLALFTAPTLHIEAEGARIKTRREGLIRRREELPDPVKDLGIGCGIAPGRLADRRLVDQHELIDELKAADRIDKHLSIYRKALLPLPVAPEHLVQQGALA